MPRGKYIRKNKRNENALITQLMQISLKIDDHIYDGKHITVSQARGFLQEITTLKLKCLPTNVRALQVIEKLTRCLRNILTEQDNRDGGYSLNTQYAGSASPVYSLADEDRIDIEEQNDVEFSKCPEDETVHKQMTLAYTSHEHEQVVTNSYKERDNILNLPIQAQSVAINPKNNLDVDKIIDIINDSSINLLPQAQSESNNPNSNLDDDIIIDSDADETSNIPPVPNEQNSSIRHLNSGTSKMTIEDGLDSQAKAEDYNCSQSILDNFENEKANKAVNTQKDNVVNKEVPHKVDAKAHVTDKVNNYLSRNKKITGISIEAAAISPTQLINRKTTNTNKIVNPIEPIVLKKKIKRRTKKTVKDKENELLENNKSKFKSNNALPNCCQDTMIAKGVAYTNNIGSSSKTVTQPIKNLKNNVLQIYNNNVENDLSWVENLRHVREISPEENDPTLSLLQDNFWDNFALPDTWNDSELN